MIQALGWFVVVVMWIIAAAFAFSDVLCILALVHHARRDPELVIVYAVVFLLFTLFGVAAAFVALSIGRGL